MTSDGHEGPLDPIPPEGLHLDGRRLANINWVGDEKEWGPRLEALIPPLDEIPSDSDIEGYIEKQIENAPSRGAGEIRRAMGVFASRVKPAFTRARTLRDTAFRRLLADERGRRRGRHELHQQLVTLHRRRDSEETALRELEGDYDTLMSRAGLDTQGEYDKPSLIKAIERYHNHDQPLPAEPPPQTPLEDLLPDASGITRVIAQLTTSAEALAPVTVESPFTLTEDDLKEKEKQEDTKAPSRWINIWEILFTVIGVLFGGIMLGTAITTRWGIAEIEDLLQLRWSLGLVLAVIIGPVVYFALVALGQFVAKEMVELHDAAVDVKFSRYAVYVGLALVVIFAFVDPFLEALALERITLEMQRDLARDHLQMLQVPFIGFFILGGVFTWPLLYIKILKGKNQGLEKLKEAKAAKKRLADFGQVFDISREQHFARLGQQTTAAIEASRHNVEQLTTAAGVCQHTMTEFRMACEAIGRLYQAAAQTNEEMRRAREAEVARRRTELQNFLAQSREVKQAEELIDPIRIKSDAVKALKTEYDHVHRLYNDMGEMESLTTEEVEAITRADREYSEGLAEVYRVIFGPGVVPARA